MRNIFFLALLFSVTAESAQNSFSIGYGPTYHLDIESSTGGGKAINANLVLRDKWSFDIDYFSQQTIYDGKVTVEPYGMFTASRRWSSDSTKIFPWHLQIGLAFSEGDSCKRTRGHQTCNAMVPSPVSLAFGVGVSYKRYELMVRHVSNAGTVWPNVGQDSVILRYRF